MLTDHELAAVILAARRMPPPYGRIVEFLALTGQRREEVAQLTWEEIDEKARTWTIPGAQSASSMPISPRRGAQGSQLAPRQLTAVIKRGEENYEELHVDGGISRCRIAGNQ